MKRPALQNKQDVLLRMAFRARKVLGTFEKRAPGHRHENCGAELYICRIPFQNNPLIRVVEPWMQSEASPLSSVNL